ncbi:hypothetical protein ELI41_21825 [Rhizobium leguminosarum]|uniref:hypothetical protein n=1 Tax=Rhizobium leguminosarum TaxID=384 RepID=UPI00102F58A9|nr:hypothetical protein [Rhizobium leguminosarum]MBY2964300.1 hypothetical protein [Rhizobium leguminosarum]TAU90992.1 hypothetical protein ELI41_21825 [Rhizobium leguminosarum]
MNEFAVRKGLVIEGRWISLILNGQKDWEMRSSATSHRGWFGLIWKGMGSVYGVVRLVDVGRPLDPDGMVRTFGHHCIPEDIVRSGRVAKWNTPWHLADVIRLPKPIRYKHPNGAVTWVNFDEQVSVAIEDQLSVLRASISEARETEARVHDDTSGAGAERTWRRIGESVVTQGNIDHNHIYLRDFFHRFPSDAIGGSNKTQKATRNIRVVWDGGPATTTDLDGSKKFFRARSWIRTFFAHHAVVPGDKVVVEEGEPYEYRVHCQRAVEA